MSWVEIIGLLGTVFVLISFFMKDVKKIRCVNIIGAILFVIYGAIINAVATWVLNGVLIVVHIVFLIKDKRNKNNQKE